MNNEKSFWAPPKLLRALRKWLSCTFNHNFQYRGNTMPLVHRTQHDWHSCGIIYSTCYQSNTTLGAESICSREDPVVSSSRLHDRLGKANAAVCPSNKQRCGMSIGAQRRNKCDAHDWRPQLSRFAGVRISKPAWWWRSLHPRADPHDDTTTTDLLNPSSDLDDGDVSNYNSEEMTLDGMSAFSTSALTILPFAVWSLCSSTELSFFTVVIVRCRGLIH